MKNHKLFWSLLVLLTISQQISAYRSVTIFTASKDIVRPITLKTGVGDYTLYDEIRLYDFTTWFEAYDGNGNKIMQPGPNREYHSDPNQLNVNRYHFTTLYPKSQSTYKGSSSGSSTSTSSSYKQQYGDNIPTRYGNYNGANYSNKQEYIMWRMPAAPQEKPITKPKQYVGKWISKTGREYNPDQWTIDIRYDGNSFSFTFRTSAYTLVKKENANNWLFKENNTIDDKNGKKFVDDCDGDADPGFPTYGVYYYDYETYFWYYRLTLENGTVKFTPILGHADYYWRSNPTYSDTYLGQSGPIEYVKYYTYKEQVAARGPQEYVDLGLSVLWATKDLGATVPEAIGDYFAWGETRPKGIYWWKTLRYWVSGADEEREPICFSKYVNHSQYGKIDNLWTLEDKDDAAHVVLGDGWRMPTGKELRELKDSCTWVFIETEKNAFGVYEITGPNGNKMYLPLPGYKASFSGEKSEIYNLGSEGCYWSSDLSEYSYQGLCLCMKPDKAPKIYRECKYFGFSIRPVKDR